MPEPGRIMQGASFGIGAMPNCFFPLLNVRDSETIRDSANIDPGIDPGSGAFTVYHNRKGLAEREIVAGEEIFVDYGYNYFITQREEIYRQMPLLDDYEQADQLLEEFRTMSQQLERRSFNKRINTQHQKNQHKTKIRKHELVKEALYELLRSILQTWASRIQGALPERHDSVNHVLDELQTTRYIHAERSKRDVKWLQVHGSCLDHLVVRNSSIPHAGRGAFANKFLPKGTIVAPVPLIHIPDREVLNIYDGYLTRNENHYRRNQTNRIHYQLLMNYCFGHHDSSLLLCPYGIASSLVNHGSSKNDEANVKIVWSNKTTSHPEWLDMKINEWAYTYRAGLAFDYVAMRDIQEGEEVLINYGDEWQAAWDLHVKNWKPRPYRSQMLNKANPPIAVPKYDEWLWPDVHLWCRNIYRDFQGHVEGNENAYPCHVIAKTFNKETDEILYTAEIVLRSHGVTEETNSEENDDEDDNEQPEPICREIFDEVLFNLPRDAFLFGCSFDWDEQTRYYSETWSFRHELRIPDEIMPAKWKNSLDSNFILP